MNNYCCYHSSPDDQGWIYTDINLYKSIFDSMNWYGRNQFISMNYQRIPSMEKACVPGN